MRAIGLALVLLAACGGDEPRPEYAESDLRSLVPADSDFVVRMRSCRRAQEVLARMAREFDRPITLPDLREQIARTAGSGVDGVVDTEPVAFAARMRRSSPGFTVIVPAADPVAMLERGPSPPRRARGGYVAIGNQAAAEGEPSPLAAGLSEADLSLCLDIRSIVEGNFAQVDAAFGLLGKVWEETPYVRTLLPDYPARAREIVDAGDTLALGLTLDGSVMEIEYAYTAREGTALAKAPAPSRLGELARYATPELSIVFLFGFEPGWLLDRQAALLAELDEAAGGETGDLGTARLVLDRVRRLLDGVGNEWMLGYGIDADRIAAVAAFRDPRAPERLAAVRAAMEEFPDRIALERTATGHRVRLRLPESAPFPELRIEAARHDDVLVVAVTTEVGLVDRVLAATTPPPLAAALQETRGELAFLLWADTRATVRGIAAFSRAAGNPAPVGAEEGPPVPMLVYGAREGRAFFGVARYDPFALDAMFNR